MFSRRPRRCAYSFVEHDGVPGQVIEAEVHQALIYLDVSREAEPIPAAETWMRADMARTVDPASGPFFTFALLKTAPREFLWYARFHHLVMDGFGGSLIARRAAEIYSALAAGAALEPCPFGSLGDLVKEDILYRKSRHFASDRQFFLDLMANCPEPPSLAIRNVICTRTLSTPDYVSRPGFDRPNREFRSTVGTDICPVHDIGCRCIHPSTDRSRRYSPWPVHDRTHDADVSADTGNGSQHRAAAPANPT